MSIYRVSPRFPLEITASEVEKGFVRLALEVEGSDLAGDVMHQVVALELESWEVIVKVDNGYQLLRYGWIWMPWNVSPRPSEITAPKWHLVESTVRTVSEAELLSKGVPIINGPIEISNGAEIIRI